VSYADIPPILGVELPKPEDFICWRKRWKKNKYKNSSGKSKVDVEEEGSKKQSLSVRFTNA
jgi:hypothetical protein